jgi:hypothetical protein
MAKQKDPGSNLTSDISQLRGLQFWEQPWETKGALTRPYGNQPMSQPTDGQMADAAFQRLDEKPEPETPTPQPTTAPKALSDGEAADLAWRHLDK